MKNDSYLFSQYHAFESGKVYSLEIAMDLLQ